MKTAKSLTEKQKKEFAVTFYERIDSRLPGGMVFDEDDDIQSSSPWGMPWLNGSDIDLSGNTVSDMVDGYLDDYAQEIENLISENA